MVERHLDLPEVLRHERPDLLLAVDHQGERGALHAPGGEELPPQPVGCKRDEAGERGTPYEVDVLPRLAGFRQVDVQRVELIERIVDLFGGEGREPRPGYRRVGVDLADEVHDVGADELALAVVVGCDHHFVGELGELLQSGDEHLLLGRFDYLRVDEVARRHLLPSAIFLGEIDLQHVAPHPHGLYLATVLVEGVNGAAGAALVLGRATGEYLRDAPRGLVFLSYYKFHS
jgi:hypothetical protein